MRAISLHQPWASAIAYGAKRVETRSWSTNYRGPLAIHAAKLFNVDKFIRVKSTWPWLAALPPLRAESPWINNKPVTGKPFVEWLHSLLPYGAIVATCEIVDCRTTGSFKLEEVMARRFEEGYDGGVSELHSWNENMFGDFALGRFGWILKDIKRLKVPIPAIGRQGFFEVEIPDSVEYA